MKKISEETVFSLSLFACILPFLVVILSYLATVEYEPYSFFLFTSYLMAGSFLGSIFGIISLICNRKIKSRKIFILSLIPVLLLLASLLDICSEGYQP